jgi:prophage antirepressor-like protein
MPNLMSTQSTSQTAGSEFRFEGVPIRIYEKDDQPVFLVKDICKCLEIANPSQTVADLKEDEKVYVKHIPGQKVLAVTEAGLYKIILRSNKPRAEPFQDLVCKTILPTIRKTGQYVATESPLLPSKSADRMSNMAASVSRSDSNTKPVKKRGEFLEWDTALGLLSIVARDLEEFESYRYSRKFMRGLSMALANDYRATRGKTPPRIRSKRSKSPAFGYPPTYKKLALAFISGWQPESIKSLAQ